MQADQVSEWFGMAHDRATPGANVLLRPDQPAYLEVTIDPAAHGPTALGPIQRGVLVTTADGQQLDFVLAATITA